MSLMAWAKERLKRRLGVPSVERALIAVRDRGFSPKVVYDVGAYHGEFATFCRRIFTPPPRVVCFEPLVSAIERLQPLEKAGDITLIPGLVGAADRDSVPFHENETASSVLGEHTTKAPTGEHPMKRLDTLIESGRAGSPPDLLKIDTQGYELDVLKGIEQNLPQVRMILAELNLLDIYEGVPLLSEVVGWLAARGWVPYEICSLIRRPLDGALWQTDFLFVQHNDPLRADKRWG